MEFKCYIHLCVLFMKVVVQAKIKLPKNIIDCVYYPLLMTITLC